MSWHPLRPTKALSANAKASAAVSLSGILGRMSKTCLVLRPRLLEGAGWLRVGARVSVLEGADEHAGMLRLQADSGGTFMLKKTGGRATNGTLMVFLPWLPGATPAKHASTAVQFVQRGDALDLMLPAWARPPAAGVARAPEAAEAARAKSAYVGVTARVPDPVAANRARSRGIFGT